MASLIWALQISAGWAVRDTLCVGAGVSRFHTLNTSFQESGCFKNLEAFLALWHNPSDTNLAFKTHPMEPALSHQPVLTRVLVNQVKLEVHTRPELAGAPAALGCKWGVFNACTPTCFYVLFAFYVNCLYFICFYVNWFYLYGADYFDDFVLTECVPSY